MALSVLMVYEPVASTRGRENYWRSYISFYEKFWDAPATPRSSWHGREYDEFREALSRELGLDKEGIEDCFFIKDSEGGYYVVPVGSGVNLNVFSAENFIPLEWFLMYEGGEKKYFYTHTGFGAIHHDAIYYNTRIEDALGRLGDAAEEIEKSLKLEDAASAVTAGTMGELSEGVRNLRDWLSGFDPQGFVLLNYGEICSHIEPDSMKNEDSVSELRRAVTLAAGGNMQEAETALRALIIKWEEISRAASGGGPGSSPTVQ